MFDVHVIETSTLGDRSYLVTDGESAAVVDPQRDVDRILALAGELGVQITTVAETHLHNDYVSGGLELSRLTGAVYALADAADFPHRALSDGDTLDISPTLRLRALHTPGHTFRHLSYILDHDGTPEGVFTGGSLLFGTTGRPDLLGHEHAETLARHQHASARRLADALPDGARIWPTHGFGSFCAVGTAGGDASTLGQQKLANPALRLAEDAFVTEVLSGLDAYPAYYAHMGAINAASPDPVDLRLPEPATPKDLARRIDAGEWVVDLRSRTAYAASHLIGTVSLGLDGSMATWLGWLTARGAPITLIGATRDAVAEARRELVRIGIDHPAAIAIGTPETLATSTTRVGSIRRATFTDLATALTTNTHTPGTAGTSVGEASGTGGLDGTAHDPRGAGGDAADGRLVVVDVRLAGEWRDGHVAGSLNIPLPQLTSRLAEIPAGEVWVHCGSGYRAAAAASLLARAGREVVIIDDAFASAADQGVPMAA
ncbi:MBL fold metallo-hydrolase [Nonomuraea endophytica]|uniref:Glyoxylase-like metal-dependent hydrolase (Beta-lactamase superfamily II)/rhodanese-related sulfurtransferase n=1 Tax=Nonomuraea endophytica TaxID=714136 RepID=A0A7W8ACA2_9ACTN|nr:MBL fold metallo-hydrolase [Nonomuraea endophytica]MBB5083473.1 glyoxylase-like metal-dependent hydrolase (beta-lactamase superfamily II)/rhodanese-related sulfurtransferase [Nonomuraea endophytica]